MALIDDILNKKKQDNSSPVTPVQDDTPNNNTQITEQSPSGNKWGYSQSEMDVLAKAGYTPDMLDRYNSDFSPDDSGNFLQKFYESSVKKPSAPDEKKLRRNRLISGVADGLGILSQMYSAGKGAHVRERDFNQSALANANKQEQNLRNIYLNQNNKYNDGLFNARLKDFTKAWDDYNAGRKGLQGVIAANNKLEENARQADLKIKYNYDKMKQDYDLKKQNQESIDRHRRALESQGWQRVADSKERTSAYVKKMSSGSGDKNNYQIVFDANPSDNRAISDKQLGDKVRVFDMNKGEIDRWARMALSDEEFMNSDSGKILITQRPKYEGTILQEGQIKYKPNQDIAAAYLKDRYEKGFLNEEEFNTPDFNFDPIMNIDMDSFNSDTDIEEDEEFPALGNIANF